MIRTSTSRFLDGFSLRVLGVVVVAILTTIAVVAQTNNYFGTSGTISGSVWSTNPAGPYNQPLNTTGGAIINFGNAFSATGASITVAGINATASNTTWTAGGTISNQGNLVIPISVASGITLDFGTQSWTSSATAGYIKNGDGVLAMSGNTYAGGFTLNAGTMIVRGVNAMGGATGNTLTINGGTLAANANRDLSGKYPGGITIGGNFTIGATTGLASSAANLTFDNAVSLGAGTTRAITIGGTGTYTFGGVISGASSNLTVNSTAAGTIVLTGANTYSGTTTVNGGTLRLNRTGGTTIPVTNNVEVNNGGTLRISTNQTLNNLTVASGGNVIIDGGATLTITGTLSTTSDITNTGALQINGILQINAGGFISTNAPTYGSASTLVYNGPGSYNVSTEWTGNNTTAGFGVPQNVTIQGGMTVNMPNSNRGMAGNLNISSGTLALNAGSGDLYLAGNMTRASGATFTPNERAVFFNGTGTQVITVTSGGTMTFNYLLIQSSSTVQLATGTNVTVDRGGGLTLGSSATNSLDLNGQTLLYSGGGNLNLSSGARGVTSSVSSGVFNTSANITVTTGGASSLTFGENVIVNVNDMVLNFNNVSTVNGTLRMNTGGASVPVPPTYGPNSTLLYRGGYHNRHTEWNALSGPGYPANVQISNNTTVNMGANSGDAFPHTCAGNVTIDAGSTLSLSISAMTAAVTVGGNLNLNGTLTLSPLIGGDIVVGGNWTEGSSSTFNANSRAVFLNGTGTQTISRSGGTNSFPYLLLGKSGGSVALSNDVTVSAVLTFQSGNTANISTGANSLILSDNSTSAIVRTGSGHVIGNLNRRCGVAGNYFFPVGTGEGYTPVNLNYSSIDQQQNVVVNSNDTDHPNFATYGLSATKYVSRHWNITRIGAGNFQVDATFTYLPADLVGGATESSIKAAKYDAPNWTLPTTTTGTNSFTATGLTSFSGFMGGETPPDYEITTTGNAIVITDNSGNGETLDVSESGSNIRFVVTPTTRTYSINGGATTAFTTPADVALAGATSITVNTAAGADIINIGAFTANLPSLTVNGGTGDDAVNFNGNIPFATNANLDVDLQNDDAVPGTDAVTVASIADIVLSGTGTATVKASKSFTLNGGTFETENGDLIVEANQQATPTGGTFVGVDINAGQLQCFGTGNVTVKGKGGNSGADQKGVYVHGTAGIISGYSGVTTVIGTGGASSSNGNHGVEVNGTASQINSFDGGNVSVTGTGGGSGSSSGNYGVYITGAGKISAGGSGTVTVQGTGDIGVGVWGANSQITSSGGAVNVTGLGDGNNNVGVQILNEGEITAGGSGSVTVQGASNSSTEGTNSGIYVASGSRITSSGGDVSVTGQAGDSNYGNNNGIIILTGGEITAGGTGSVTVQGTGGASTGDFNIGILVGISSITTSQITSSGGAVSVTGQGGGISSSGGNYGIYVIGGEITSGGSGTVTVQGTGGASTGSSNFGVYVLDTDSKITSSGGNVEITGIEGGGPSGTGIVNQASATITTATNGGNITLIANSMALTSAVSTNGSSSTTLRPYTNGVQINLGSATNPIGGPLGLSDTELDLVTTGTLIIGDANSGAITVSDNITRTASTNMELHSGGDVLLSGGGINTAGGTLLLDPGTSPAAVKPTFTGTDATASTLSFASDLAIAINGTTPGDGTGMTYSQLTVVGAVNLTGVDLILSGSHTPIVGQTFTIVDNDGADVIIGTFTGLPQGASISNFLGSGLYAIISYTGGTGNDVVLTVVQPDYTITTTGNAIVITDLSGNGETLAASESGSNIRFVVTPTTRTYSINGGPITAFTTPADVALAGATSITINTAAGDDIVNIGAFTANLPSLTVNGGTGDDAVNFNGNIPFATNANLDVDLQNDDATPGTDAVTVNAGVNLLLSGTGAVVVKASKNVLINQGSIETVNGNLTVEANQQTTSSTGTFAGVQVAFSGTLKSTGSGAISVKGKGGTTGTTSHGVYLSNSGKIEGGTGPVTVEGTGGSSFNSNIFGVYVEGINAKITSSGGNVGVQGAGSGSGPLGLRVGVYVLSGGEISAAGAGTVTVVGTGGNTSGGFNHGVRVEGGNSSQITSAGGNVTVTGTGGGTSAGSNYGVEVTSAGQITAGGMGTVTVTGTGGGATGSGNRGVVLSNVNSRITSSGGNVVVNGTGGGTGTSGSNYGVHLTNGAEITAGSTGNVTVTGTASATPGSFNYGVYVESLSSKITSSGGDVYVEGTGNASGGGTDNYGVFLESTGQITAGSGGDVQVVGMGAINTGSNNNGIRVTGAGSTITSTDGNVQVSGTGGGSGSSASNFGVYVNTAGKISAGGTGTTTVLGTGGTSSGNNNYGIWVSGTNSQISSTAGNVSVTGQGGGSGSSASNFGVDVHSGGVITAGGTGTVTVQGTGGSSTGPGNYGVFVIFSGSSITSSGGDVSVSGTGGGSGSSLGNYGVGINGADISAGGAGTLTIQGTGGTATGSDNNGVIMYNSGATITTGGGNISVTGIEGGGASGTGIVQLSSSTGITTATNGGNISLIANSMRIESSVSTNGSGSTTLRPHTNGVQINLGSATDPIGGPLGLTDTELDLVTTGTLVIGNANSGAIIVSADITRPASTNVELHSAGDVTFSTGGINTGGGTLLLDPGTSPAAVKPVFTGTDATASTVSFASDLNIDIDGTTAGTQYNQLTVVGSVDLTGVDLTFLGSSHVPVIGNTFTIVDNDGVDAIIGTFTGLAEGAYITNFLSNGFYAKITYVGGTGNDVVLTVVALDYAITTTGNAIVITDNSGNSDVLDVSENGGNIRFEVIPDTRTYSIDGGPITAFATPADVALAGVTSIEINAEDGNDNINISDFTANLPSLTINGGTGDDEVYFGGGITFAADANLDVDLQDDDATPGTDRVEVNLNAELLLSGTGSATIKVSRDVLLNSGAVIETANGDLTVEANQQATPTSGGFVGVDVDGGSIKITGTGILTVKGRGGNSGSDQYGVQARNGGKIEGGSGLVTVQGTGGAASGEFNYGVYVLGTDSRITSSGGDVSVTGQGGGTGASEGNFGVYVVSAGQITAGGSGKVTVQGTGGAASGNGNYGVIVSDTDSRITSSGGDVSVTGLGGGTGASGSNIGVFVLAAGQITAGGSGKVTVQGTGGAASGDFNSGVYVFGTDSRITSSGGDVSVTGLGGGTGASASNIGVWVISVGQITAGGSGKVTVQGTGGAASGNENFGVFVSDPDSRITSSGGNVSVSGVEGGGPSGTGFVNQSDGLITTVPNGGNITLIANSMSIGALGVSTPTGNSVTLRPYTNDVQINLGSGTDPIGGPLGLSDTELDLVTTGTLLIGDANSGAITVSADITRPASTNVELHSAGDVTFSGGGITTGGGTLLLDPGTSPAAVKPVFTGTDATASTVSFASDLNIDIDGTTAGTQYNQLTVVGSVNLTGVTLKFLGSSHTPTIGETFTIVDNDDTDAVIGTFNGLPQNAIIPNFLGSGLGAQISYIGGTGNDVVLTVVVVCSTITFTATPANACGLSSDGQIAISGETGGTGPYMYSIDNGTNYQMGATFNGLAANTYQVKIKDANGCESAVENVMVGSTPTTTYYRDIDGDGLGDPNDFVMACTLPSGYVTDNTDACPLTVSSVSNTNPCGCDPGYYPVYTVMSGENVITGCQICPTGSYCPDGLAGPILCPAGSYSDVTGATECTPCEAGSYSDVTGATECTPCEAGSYSDVTGATECTPCPAGSYSDVTGATECTPCPAGQYNDLTGQTECTPCPAGQYNGQTGQTECLDCPNGTFNNNTGQTACTNCPTITFTATPSIPCSGGPNGVIAISAESGGVGLYMYSIDNGMNYQSGATFTGLSPDTYPVKIKDANGCESAVQNVVLATGEPEMAVSCNANPINDGDNTTSNTNCTDFGCAQLADGMVEFTYTITNDGDCDLTLNGSPLVLIGGLHAGDFAVTQQPASTVSASGGTTTFKIKFDPTAAGTRVATVIIANDDSDENPYTFEIQGLGAGVVATCPSDVTICAGDMPYTLSGGLPSGGVFSGTGVGGNLFSVPPPTLQSFFDVFYTVTDPVTMCENTCQFQITVNPYPETFGISVPICSNYDNLVAYLPTYISNGVAADFTWTFTDNPNVTGEADGSGDLFYADVVNTSNVVQPVFYTVTPTAEGTGCVGPTFSIQVNIWPLPSITCPEPVSINTDAGLCTANSTLTHPALVTDNANCPATLSVAFSNGTPAPASLPTGGMVTPGVSTAYTFAKGQTVVTYTATDSEGNPGTCAYTVTVTDNQPPTATCQSATVILDGSGNATLAAASVNNGSADNCGVQGVSVSPSAFTCANVTPATPTSIWINEIHYDNSGADANEFVELAGNAGINLANYALVRYNGTSTPSSATIYSTPAQTTTLTGTIPNQSNGYGTFAVFFAVDGLQNGANDGFALVNTVTNTVVQLLSYEGAFTVGAGQGLASGMTSTNLPVSEGGGVVGGSIRLAGNGNQYSGFTWQSEAAPASPGAINAGQSFPAPVVNTVTLTVTDNSGLQSTCSAAVSVFDNAAPTLACPMNQSVTTSSNGTGDCTGAYTIPDPVSDNCTATWGYSATGVTTIASVTGVADGANSPALSFNKGVSTVTLTATDGSGNIATTCSFSVTVTDNEAPTLSCPGDITLSPAINTCTASTTISDPVSDNCTGATWTYSASGATTIGATTRNDGQNSVSIAFNGGITTVTITAMDAASNNNAIPCTYTVTVEDDQAPVARCKTGFATLDANGMATITGVDVDNGSTDNCGAPSLSVSPNSFNCSQLTLPVSNELFFSEYVEGSGNNKYLEIYNPTPVAVNLANYQLRLYANGDATPTTTNTLSGMLAPGATIVYRNSSATIFTGTSTALSSIAFNGNDAIALFNTVTNQNVDIFDRIGNDPGTSWNDGIINYTTLDKTLRRKSTVSQGVTVNPSGTGPSAFTTLTTEWDLFNIDVVIGLGRHIGPGVLVTLTATDGLGSTSTCSASVVVRDVTAPTLTCPTNQNLTTSNNGTGDCIGGYTIADPVSDNCTPTWGYSVSGATTIAAVTGVADGANSPALSFNKGMSTVTLTATDGSGNAATTCSFTVTVTDNEAPAIACPTAIAVNTDPGQCTAVVNYTAPVGTDNCPGQSTAKTDLTGLSSGSAFPKGTTVLEYTVTDAATLTSSCSFSVIVTDNQPPTITCAAGSPFARNTDALQCNYTVQGTEFDPTAFGDNCPGATLTNDFNNSASLAGEDLPKGPTTIIWTVTDGMGMASATCEITVNVTDNQPPIITCPAGSPFARNTDPGECNYTVQGTEFNPIFVNDNCPGVFLTNSFNGNASLEGWDLPKGSTTVTWTLTESMSTVTSTCSITVIVTDDQPPTITCPAGSPFAKNTDAGQCNYTVQGGEFNPTFGDNCPGVTISNDFNNMNSLANVDLPKGSHTITWTVTDGMNMASTTCQIVVNVADNQPPTITCPAGSPFAKDTDTGQCNYTVQGAEFNPTFGDNCPGATITNDLNNSNTLAGVDLPKGSHTITWTVTDGMNMASTTCAIVVNVSDNELPTITCPANQTISLDNACEAEVPDYTGLATGVTDNCSMSANIAVTQSPAAGGTFSTVGPHTVTLTATDEAGKTQDCTFSVTGITREIDVRGNGMSIADGDNTPDPADHTNFGGTTPGVPIMRTFTVHNTGGQTLVINSISSNNTNFTLTALVPFSMIPAGMSATFTVTFQAAAPGPYLSTITIMSNDCDEGTYTFDVLAAVDCVPPVVTTCPGAQNVSAASGQCNAAVSYSPVATGTPTPTWSYQFSGATTGSGSGTGSGSTFNVGMTTVVLTATNTCGTTSCTFVVTVNDTQLPTITCPPPTTVSCAGNVPAPNPASATASDNCIVASKEHVFSTPFNIVCANRFEVLRVYRATDGSNNSNTCSQVITVYDNTLPTFTFVPANVTVQCNSVPAVGSPSASDNCGGSVSIAYNGQTVSNILCMDKYTLTRQWTATDACGNTKTATQRIVVTDTQLPNFTSTPANVTVQCDAIPPVATPVATDNCDPDVAITYIGQTRTNGTCLNRYTLTRRWVASDNCNNTRSISQRITVVDNGKPTLSLPPDATIACSDPIPPVGTATATDGCEGTVVVTYLGQTTVSGTCPASYQIKRIWKATDACGNSTAATQTIQVSDSGVPVFTSVPGPLTIECDDPLPPLVNPTASDACGGYVHITFLGNVPSGSGCSADYTITRTWRADDLCGNTATTTQVITVLGNSYGGDDPAGVSAYTSDGTRMTRMRHGLTRNNQADEKSVEIRVPSVSSVSHPAAFALQPNPTTDRFRLDLTDFAGEAVTVSIYGELGQLVWENRIPAVEDLQLQISLREAGAAAGIYTVSVRSASGVVAKRVVLVE